MAKMPSSQSVVSIATSSTQLVSQSPQRVGLIIGGPIVNRFTISLESTAVLDQGITLGAAAAPLMLNIRDHGDLVTRALTAISATASQNVTVISIFGD